MKLFNELTEQEILESYNDLSLYVDRQLLENGVKIVESPKMPIKPEITGNVLGFIIPLIGKEICFKTEDAAKKVVALLLENTEIVENSYTDTPTVKSFSSYHTEKAVVVPTMYFSKELKDNLKKVLDKHKKEENEYLKNKEIYDKYCTTRHTVETPIYDKYKQVVAKYDSFETNLNLFKNRYLPVSESFEQAMKYFKVAIDVSEECEEYINTKYTNELF